MQFHAPNPSWIIHASFMIFFSCKHDVFTNQMHFFNMIKWQICSLLTPKKPLLPLSHIPMNLWTVSICPLQTFWFLHSFSYFSGWWNRLCFWVDGSGQWSRGEVRRRRGSFGPTWRCHGRGRGQRREQDSCRSGHFGNFILVTFASCKNYWFDRRVILQG